MINNVIFDVDGTLVDSVDMHAKAWQEVMKNYGKDVPFQDVRNQIGKGGDQLMPVFFSPQQIDDFGEKMEQERGELFQSKYLSQVKPFPKVRELFQRIKADNKKIALASSAVEKELEHYKKLLNIAEFLEAATTSDDADASKPEPDIFLAAMKQLGNPNPAEAIVIGDTPYDAIAAKKANLKTIGFLCGGFPEEQLRKEGCAEIYRDPADLLARYEESMLIQNTAKGAGK